MPVLKSAVRSIAKSGSSQLKGDVTLSAGSNITLTQSGQDIQIAASGGSSGVKLYTLANNVTVSNTTTQTDLISFTVPGGTLSTNNAVFVRMTILSVAGVSGNITIRFKYGGTQTDSATLTLSSTFETGVVEYVLYGDGSTSAQESSVEWRSNREFTGGMGNTRTGTDFTSAGTAAVDSTSDQTLVITAQFSSANASNAITIQDAFAIKIT